MKKYKDIALCASSDSETFLDKINKTIGDFQKRGYEAEVHYAPAGGQLTALIFSYINE